MTHTEIIDLVDDNDQVIGQIQRDDHIYNKEVHGGNIRVVNCFIRNDDGELWVPIRTPDKKLFPNGIDFSAAEHLNAGESYAEAVVRGFEEELCFTPDQQRLVFLGKIAPIEGGDVFQGVYAYNSNDTPNYNPRDFSRAEWLSPVTLLQRIRDGAVAKPHIASTVEKFFL